MKELPLLTSSQPLTVPVPVPEVDGGVEVEVDLDGLRRSVVRVDGMDCASCALTLERVVRAMPGVGRVVVNFGAGRMDVHHDERVDDADLAAAVRRAGFTVRAAPGAQRPALWRSRRFAMLCAAALLAGAAIITSSVALFVVSIVAAGWPVLRAAWTGLRARSLDMNVLMAAATVGAAVLGQWPEAVAIVLLFSLGNLLQVHAVERTRSAVAALAEIAPADACVVEADGSGAREVPVESVAVGAHVLVRPGERVALDAVVVEGATTMDESPITGEGIPVEKAVGDAVLSGSLNGSGAVLVRVVQVAASSTLQRIVQLVEQAQATAAPSEQFVARFSRIYTPLVVGLALLLGVLPGLVTGDWATWTYRALALLIIACPCSLVISTPVTVVSGIGAASRRGILVKGGEALEAAGRLRAIALDKTGTLTEGRPVLASTSAADGVRVDDALRIAAALERRSEHPLAHAIVTAAGREALPAVEDFVSIPGRGASGIVDGAPYLVGSPRLFAERGVPLARVDETAVAAVCERGETPVLLGTSERLLAVFGIADAIRPEARSAIAALRRAGIERVVMLTGDSEGAARRVAQELGGIEARAGLLPEDKVDAVAQLAREHGTVGMVGDGVNDAPALAAATVSFAMGAAGTGVALEAADIAIMQDDLRALGEAVELSRSAGRVLRQNIVASIVVKGAFVLLAPFGLVTLWVAVAADMGTSLAVTGNGLRLLRRPQRRRPVSA